jgi:hypothetical protein
LRVNIKEDIIVADTICNTIAGAATGVEVHLLYVSCEFDINYRKVRTDAKEY